MSFLSIRNLSKKYKNQVVLQNINLDLPSTGLICLIGESGGGKSTFLNCITGIEKKDKGTIYFQGKKVRNFETFRNKYIGMIYQNSNMISFFNGRENIAIKGNSQTYKIKVDEFIDSKTNVLSQGEIQRIGILRALNSNCKILLCDEPTGSLDEENVEVVMKTLKEISKEILVVVVTHSKYIVNKFSDCVLKLENNNIKGNINYKDKNNEVFSKKVTRIKMKYILKSSIKTLLKNKSKCFLSILSLSLSLSFFLFTNNASNNINDLIKENKSNYLDYNLLRIVNEKTNKIGNTSLTLVKEERLEKDNILELNYLIDYSYYMYDLTPIFTYYPSINCPISSNVFFTNIEFVPYIRTKEKDFKNKIEGRFPKKEYEVVINKACRDLLSTTSFKIKFDKQIDLKLDNNKIISDYLSIDINFNITGLVQEFDFLQTPKIYYPYDYLASISKNIKLDNLSSYYQTDIYLYDRLTTLRGEDDSFSSAYLYLNVDKDSKVEEIYERVNSIGREKEKYKVVNSNIQKIQSFNNVFDAIEQVLLIFVSITLIISILLLILIIYSYVLDYKKDIGIMMGSGILRSDISKIFTFQSILLISISQIISLILFYSLNKIINKYLYGYLEMNILSNNIDFSQIISIFIVILLLTFLCSLMINRKISRLNIASILREE